MADDGKNSNEPTMEEILASIRRIIADEKDPAAAPAEAPPVEEPAAPVPPSDDVLELTQMVLEDGSVVDLAAKEPSPEPPPPKETPVEQVADKPVEPDSLISEKAAKSAMASLATLASTVNIERMAAAVPTTPLGNGGRTLEDMVMELMKPLLREWLDAHLPGIVEKIVQKEIERIAHHVQD